MVPYIEDVESDLNGCAAAAFGMVEGICHPQDVGPLGGGCGAKVEQASKASPASPSQKQVKKKRWNFQTRQDNTQLRP